MSAAAKLIRDRRTTPEEGYEGESYDVVTADPRLMPALLTAKMHEEVQEIANAPRDVYEYGDLLQAMIDHAALFGITLEMMNDARLHKLGAMGGFSGRQVLVR